MNSAKSLTARFLLGAVALTIALTGCTSPVEPVETVSPSPTVTVTPEPSPEPAETAAAPEPTVEPTPEPEPEPELVADEFSQVIDGVLYQGTERAPVLIGDDIPGQPPAAETGYSDMDRSLRADYAESQGKYVVSIGCYQGQCFWKVFGVSRFGTFRELDNNGYQNGHYFATVQEAIDAPKTLDGRVLDRAEYVLGLP